MRTILRLVRPYTSVQRRSNSLVLILYNATYITFVALALKGINITNYNYNFAQVVYRIAFIFMTFQYFFQKKGLRGFLL